MNNTMIKAIAQTAGAYRRCAAIPGHDWTDKHYERLLWLQDQLPSGSGIDSGTKINIDATTEDKVVLDVSFHHMDEMGGYDGWTEHVVIVRPAFNGLNLRITGRDRNQVKGYLYQVFEHALLEDVPQIARIKGLKDERHSLTEDLEYASANTDMSATITRIGELNVEIADLERKDRALRGVPS